MRKVKFLQDYKSDTSNYKKGEIVKMGRDRANRLMIAGIVTYYL